MANRSSVISGSMMSASDVSVLTAQQSRTRQLVWPREHGAWGILLVPLITGALIGIRDGGAAMPALLFAGSAFALFCLRTPVESLMGTSPMRVANREERRVVVRYAFLFGTVAFVALGALFSVGPWRGLTLFGIAVVALFGLQTIAKKLGRKGRMPSQMIGALALTSTAAGAYFAATAHFDIRAVGLWFANWMFAGNQIHFVQLRLHAAKCGAWKEKFLRGRGFFVGQILMIMGIAGAWLVGIVPGLVLLAFAPISLRGIAWFFRGPQPLVLHRLGMEELAHAVTFGILLVFALH